VCAEAGMRQGIVVKKKDILHILVRTNYRCIVAVCLKFSCTAVTQHWQKCVENGDFVEK
jgi:hypothetical protein